MKDWTNLREAYVNTGKSLRALAREHGVSFHSLSKVCERERWPFLRRFGRDREATAPATLPATTADKLATWAEPHPLSMPERSNSLRARIVSELERDTAQVEKTEPRSLADSEQRQSVIGSVVRSASTVLEWGDRSPASQVRIAIMSSTSVQIDHGQNEPSLPALPAPSPDDTGPDTAV